MIEGVRDKLKAIGYEGDTLEQTRITADAGFHSEKNLKMIYVEGIDAFIADKQFRKRDPKFADVQKYKERTQRERSKRQAYGKPFQHPILKFADDLSHCICPAGQRLYRNGGDIYTQGWQCPIQRPQIIMFAMQTKIEMSKTP